MKVVTCIMFKNEEEILERCLKNIEPYTDEFVLLDTGSEDSSIEIASCFGEVYEEEFEDFVITKNKALEIAETKDADIIIWMDADEYLKEGQEDLFKQALEDLHNSDKTVLITDINDAHQGQVTNEYIRPRAWKTNRGVVFKGPGIHEFISYSDGDLFRKDIKIIHKHKTKGKDYQATTNFYLDILHKYEQKDNTDIRAKFYLARTYFDIGDDLKAIEFYQKYRETCQRINYIFLEEYWYSMYEEAKALKRMGEYEKALTLFRQAIDTIPERAEAYAEAIDMTYYKMHDVKTSIEIGEVGRHYTDVSNFKLFTDIYSYPYKILDILSLCYWDIEEYQKGLDLIDELLSLPLIENYHHERIKANRPYYANMTWYKKKPYNINTYFDNIFCINLERRTDRKEKVEEKFKKLGITPEWFRGYDGKLLEPFVDTNIMVRRTGGYIGCLLSHLEVMKISLSRGYKRVLILEDDLAIHNNLKVEFERIINQIEHNEVNWDVLFLGHAAFSGDYDMMKPEANQEFYAITDQKFEKNYVEAKNTWALHAYALSEKAMKEILNYYETNGYHNELDRVLAGVYMGKEDNPLNFYNVYPQLFVQNDTISDNDPTGMSANHFERFINKQYSVKGNYL